ncbi:PREDICTED: uncharacterized protein LOC106805622 [Priapulus caudatus]|uniref:Uncharacterized protein LOC106805622 n=1 Tax=Priapulus caudatus TaxID=37621 RepID=A0ABM1DS72_PRICU|nr:PREDICTED: uncharacterized protein LOC106805622 [Priapulus caudatus]
MYEDLNQDWGAFAGGHVLPTVRSRRAEHVPVISSTHCFQRHPADHHGSLAGYSNEIRDPLNLLDKPGPDVTAASATTADSGQTYGRTALCSATSRLCAAAADREACLHVTRERETAHCQLIADDFIQIAMEGEVSPPATGSCTYVDNHGLPSISNVFMS